MSLDSGQANLLHSAVFVDELVRRGLRHAVLCPGSRSTPLAVALAVHPGVRAWVHVDERSAAYFALGMARQRRGPVAVLSTSGTAAANFLPAVVEAGLSRIPLVILTADRPPELRDWGAPQAIDQLRLYGDHAKWFVEMPVPTGDASLLRQTRAVAARAFAYSQSEPYGPVHLNVPYREPLLPDDLFSLSLETMFASGHSNGHGDIGRAPVASPHLSDLDALSGLIRHEPRGIIVCGPGETSGLGEAASRFASVSGYPILADPLSGLRFGGHDRSAIVDAYDAFLRDGFISPELTPDLIIQIGAAPTSKPLQQFLARAAGRPYVLLDPGDPRDPWHLGTIHLRTDPAATLATLAEKLDRLGHAVDDSWCDRWLAVDRSTRVAIDQAISCEPRSFEGSALADVAAALPDGATLVVGNSMPVRDADAFIRGDSRHIRVLANRGANGIDGVVSTALGAAAVAEEPVVLVVGDLSFYHDLNGLLAAKRFDINATIVVLNNDGGGIFSFLPQADQLDAGTFETLFGTPIGLDFGMASQLYGASYARPTDRAAFRHVVCRAVHATGLSVIEYVTDRDRNVGQHRAVWAAVGSALRSNHQPTT